MELRDYAAILNRRWPIVVLVALVALAVGAAFTISGPRAYEATIRLGVSVGPDPRGNPPPYVDSREYYLWLASEYLADDLGEVVKSDAFAGDVSAYLSQQVNKAAVRDVVRVRKTHRILEITAQAPSAEEATRIAAAIGEVAKAQAPKYLAQLASPTGQIVVLDAPFGRPATTTGSQLLDVGLRAALGLVLGLFLAFIVDYLDATFRTTREVERTLGLPILGEIPGS